MSSNQIYTPVNGYRFQRTSLIKKILEVVEEYSDKIAVTEGDKSISYKELDSLSSKVACVIQDTYRDDLATRQKAGRTHNGNKTDAIHSTVVIGIYLPRSIANVVSWLGAAKSGITYAPIGLDWPDARIERIIERTGMKAVLTSGEQITGQSWSEKVKLIDVNALISSPAACQDISYMDEVAEPAPSTGYNPLYVIHTSGSTGEPKGVILSHEGVCAQFSDPAVFAGRPGMRIMHVNAVTFDLSIQEVWGALLSGCAIIITETPVSLDAVRLRKHFEEYGVELAILSTAVFNILAFQDAAVLRTLEAVTICGELPNRQAIEKVYRACPETTVLNCYGPAECTVFASSEAINEKSFDYKTIPAGVPTPAAALYIVDEQMAVQPAEVVGEVLIGSECVGLGYIRDAERTAKAFVRLPGTDETVYRTGDYGMITEDGKLIVLGRMDNQVKISGYRVEPGEICGNIMKAPGVQLAHVMIPKTEYPEIIAYVVPEKSGQDRSEQTSQASRTSMAYSDTTNIAGRLRDFLQTQLPAYMIPRHIVIMDSLPLNVHGKIDSSSLPPPRAKEEEELDDGTILGMFRAILNNPDFSEEDSFLEAGGTSIKAARLIVKLRKLTGVFVPFTLLGSDQTVSGVSLFVENAKLSGAGNEMENGARTAKAGWDSPAGRLPQSRTEAQTVKLRV